MYQPKLKDENVRGLYVFAKHMNLPMTQLLNQIVEEWLKRRDEDLNLAYRKEENRETAF